MICFHLPLTQCLLPFGTSWCWKGRLCVFLLPCMTALYYCTIMDLKEAVLARFELFVLEVFATTGTYKVVCLVASRYCNCSKADVLQHYGWSVDHPLKLHFLYHRWVRYLLLLIRGLVWVSLSPSAAVRPRFDVEVCFNCLMNCWIQVHWWQLLPTAWLLQRWLFNCHPIFSSLKLFFFLLPNMTRDDCFYVDPPLWAVWLAWL